MRETLGWSIICFKYIRKHTEPLPSLHIFLFMFEFLLVYECWIVSNYNQCHVLWAITNHISFPSPPSNQIKHVTWSPTACSNTICGALSMDIFSEILFYYSVNLLHVWCRWSLSWNQLYHTSRRQKVVQNYPLSENTENKCCTNLKDKK